MNRDRNVSFHSQGRKELNQQSQYVCERVAWSWSTYLDNIFIDLFGVSVDEVDLLDAAVWLYDLLLGGGVVLVLVRHGGAAGPCWGRGRGEKGVEGWVSERGE